MRIFRIETDDGVGPFTSGMGLSFELADAIGDPNYYQRLPNPIEDWGIRRWSEPNELCGCVNARQFVRWFPRPARKLLRRYRFEFVIYEAEPSAVGTEQVLFIKTTDTRVVHCRSV